MRKPCVFYLFLFYLIICFMKNIVAWSSFDELFEIFFLLFLFVRDYAKKEFVTFLCTAVIILLYSLFFSENNNYIAVLSDALQIFKPFIYFYFFYYNSTEFTHRQKSFAKMTIVILSVLSLVSYLIDPSLRSGVFSHPLQLGVCSLYLGILFWYFSDEKKKVSYLNLVIFCIGLLCMKGKFYGEFTLLLIILFIKEKIVLKNVRGFVIIVLSLTCVLFVAWNKISTYFISNHEEQARAVLYAHVPQIFADYPLFGSGLATYGTWFSGVYYSPLYIKYEISNIYGLSSTFYAYVADTWFPCLVQVGLFGLCFLGLFWAKRMREINHLKNMKDYKISLFIIGSLIVESVAGATFVSCDVFAFMFVLANILGNANKKGVQY